MLKWIKGSGVIYLVLGLLPAIIYLIVGGDTQTRPLGNTVTVLMATLPLIAFAALGFLGLKLNQVRIFISALVLLGLFYLLRNPGLLKESFGVDRLGLPRILAISLPFSMALIFVIKENRLWSFPTLVQVVLGLAPPVFFLFLLRVSPKGFAGLLAFRLVGEEFTRLPHLTFVPLVGLGIAAWLNHDRKVRPYLVSLLYCMIPLMLAFHLRVREGVNPQVATFVQNLSLLSVSLILLHTIFSMYWQRVYVDELTAVPNRRALDERLERLPRDYAMAMVDIDHFKDFNDNYGHEEGDNVLRLVAALMDRETGGRIYRYGGEEFCAIFEGPDSRSATTIMDKARKTLEKRVMTIRRKPMRRKADKKRRNGKKAEAPKGKKVRVTVSVGVAQPTKGAPTPDEVIKLADKALYKAKDSGRNQVVTA